MKGFSVRFFKVVFTLFLALCFFAGLPGGGNGLAIAQNDEGNDPSPQVMAAPTPTLPSGIISDTTPTFKWTRTTNATKYNYTLYKGTVVVYTKEVLKSACGTSTVYCQTTPTRILSDGIYAWKVRAYVNNTWSSFSVRLAFTVKTIPTPKSPIGVITDSTPTFKWGAIKNATQYTYNLYKNSVLVYSKTVPSTACTATTCSATPAEVLVKGTYTWKVRAFVNGTWSPFSPVKNFTLKTLLKVWSFSQEVMTWAVVFEQAHPDVVVEFTGFGGDLAAYQEAVLNSIGTPSEPDVITLEASFVKSWVNDDFLADLSSLNSDVADAGTYDYVIDAGTSGMTLKALSFQFCPGVVFYRRSIAEEVFGDDDPAYIQTLFSDWTKFTTAAGTLAGATDNVFTVGSFQEFERPFIFNRTDPWVVENTLTIDDMIETMATNAKDYYTNGYSNQYLLWQEPWFDGMNDDIEGSKIFTYFIPPWGLPFVIMPNSPDTGGDWATVAGPMPYVWGGTWLGVMSASDKQTLAKEFVRFSTLDTDNLADWATGVYTHDYLAAIDPTIPADLSQPAGDFVSSKVVVDDIKDTFTSGEAVDFLGGQNMYEIYAQAAELVSYDLMQENDETIWSCLQDPMIEYIEGRSTLEEMWAAFKTNVHIALPDMIIPE